MIVITLGLSAELPVSELWRHDTSLGVHRFGNRAEQERRPKPDPLIF